MLRPDGVSRLHFHANTASAQFVILPLDICPLYSLLENDTIHVEPQPSSYLEKETQAGRVGPVIASSAEKASRGAIS